MEYTKKQRDVLRCLLAGNKGFTELRKALNFNDMTLTRQLKFLENNKYISYNHVNRSYIITSNGLILLNEFDIETKGKIFAISVFEDIDTLFKSYFFFDDRISNETFNDLKELLIITSQNLDQKDQEAVTEWSIKIFEHYLSVLKDQNISFIQPCDLKLRPEFFDILSKIIGSSIMYLSIKYMENKDPVTLHYLSTLPDLLAAHIIKYELSPSQFKQYIGNNLIELDNFFSQSQTITPEKYKKII